MRGNPKLFLEVTTVDIKSLKVKEGTLILGKNEMIVGYEEAMMMIKEKLIQKPGDSLKDFFGVPNMKVVGILAPSGSVLDKYHLVNSETFKYLTNEGSLQTVTEDDGGVELFYTISNQVPEKFKKNIDIGSLKIIVIGKKSYVPMYFGSDEAEMMMKKGEFKKEGDSLKELGNNIIVAGILPKTGTALDNMHFAGNDFRVND